MKSIIKVNIKRELDSQKTKAEAATEEESCQYTLEEHGFSDEEHPTFEEHEAAQLRAMDENFDEEYWENFGPPEDYDSDPQPQQTIQKHGTRELSETSMNSLVGCRNSCLFCFAAHNAVEKGFVRSRDAWAYEKVRKSLPDFNRKYSGRVMYPTNHDITPRNLPVHVQAVGALLTAGNELVVCSKARFACIQTISEECSEHKDKVVFMITITSLDEGQSIFWEPNAPLPAERIKTLEYLHAEGFKTSVLVEPLLQGPGSAIDIYNRVIDFVTDEIWFGTMNYVDTRVDMSNPDNAKATALIKRYHSRENMRFLYDALFNLPKVRFKRSILAMNEGK